MEGYEHPRCPLVWGNKEIGNYAKALGQRFYGGPDKNLVPTNHLNKAVARPRKFQIIQLDMAEEFPPPQEMKGIKEETTNSKTKNGIENKNNTQEELKKQMAPTTRK
eukprot:11113236-Ditylum_brightwellii.AAC.1